jgi:peroxiredoxin-like protein
MTSQLHKYESDVRWTGGREGAGHVTAFCSGTTVPLAVPPEFGGPEGFEDACNPEELLTSAIASCYGMTLGIILTNRKLAYSSINVHASGYVEQSAGLFTYKKVAIDVTVALPSSASDDQVKAAEEMTHKADAYCIVTNALRGKVEVEVVPTITR